MEYGDKIFKLMQSIERNRNTPDLHSFTARIKNGTVFVEGREGEAFIDERYDNGKENQFCGCYMAVTNRLEMLGLDLDSVEI